MNENGGNGTGERSGDKNEGSGNRKDDKCGKRGERRKLAIGVAVCTVVAAVAVALAA